MERDDFLYAFATLLLITVAWGFWRTTRKSSKRWIIWTGRVSTSILGVSSAVLILVGIAAAAWNRGLYVYSDYPAPDGRHVARLCFVRPGALGDDMVLVQIHRNWFHSWETVNKFFGTQSDGYKLSWTDGKHLSIRKPVTMLSTDNGLKPYAEPSCDSEVDGVHIDCRVY